MSLSLIPFTSSKPSVSTVLRRNNTARPRSISHDTHSAIHAPRAPPTPRTSRTTETSNRSATQRLADALHGSLASSTRKKYGYTVREFARFCMTHDLTSLPASENTLCQYAAQGVGRIAGTTARNAISAVRAHHLDSGHTWNGSTRLSRVLRGVERLAPLASKRALRPAVTADMIKTLVRHLDISTPEGAAVAAIAATAFWAQARLGELLPTSPTSFDPAHLPTRHDLGPLTASRRSRPLHLPFTKVKRQKGETVTITNQSGGANPLPLLANHLDINHLPPTAPLFAYSTPTGHTLLSKREFMVKCNAIWSTRGEPRSTGHCFCIGGTTELLAAGVPPDMVKKAGRWASDSFLRYWRKDAALGEAFIADSSRRTRQRKTS